MKIASTPTTLGSEIGPARGGACKSCDRADAGSGGGGIVADQATIEHVLRGIALFQGLTPDTYADLARQARPVRFNAGEMIFGRGDKGDDVVIMLSGRVRLSVLSLEGRELSFSHAGPGDVFGEIAALDRGIRTADATAITAVEAVTLTHTVLTKLIAISPIFAQRVISSLCQKLRQADVQLETVALHAIEVRLARFLLGLIRQQYPAAENKHTLAIKLDMSQSEIALLIGASRPKVNSALTLLETDGAITRRGETLECVVARLKNIAAIE
jgi:CRP/FNR family transcriptional regulator, cyclic AMP receptor protein